MPAVLAWPDQAAAQQAAAAFTSLGRALFQAAGYQVDPADGSVVGRRASDGAPEPAAAGLDVWDTPRLAADGSGAWWMWDPRERWPAYAAQIAASFPAGVVERPSLPDGWAAASGL